MTKKQSPCMPTWSIPNNAAKQLDPLISLQHDASSMLRGSTRILANDDVVDVVPKRTK